MCRCKKIKLEELHYKKATYHRGYYSIPLHTCGKYVSGNQLINLVRNLWMKLKRGGVR